MALRQRIDKKGTGGQAQAMPGRKSNPNTAGVPAYTMPAGNRPHAYNMGIPSHVISAGKYPQASNMNGPIYTVPVNKQPYSNMNVPIHTMTKSKQQAPKQQVPNPTTRISQQGAALDVAVPSSFWKLRPHISLDFDSHRQKVVPKQNQIAASWRHLSPQLQWKKNEHTAVADVFEVPPELFQLKDLKNILSLEAWKDCLSLSERRFLRQLLPEGFDYGTLVRTIFRGENFFFGNPLANWDSLLLKGELHPDLVEQKELELKQAYDEHYQRVHDYHKKMLETLKGLKEEWILCKSKKKRVTSNTRQKSKRQKVANFQHALGTNDLPPVKDTQNIKSKLDNCVHSDGCTKSLHVLKVTRKQYDDILDLIKGKGDELSVGTLSPMLNFQQKFEVGCANDCDGKDALKVYKYWSQQVVVDILAAHSTFDQRKADKHRLAKLAADQCTEYYSVFTSKDVHLDLQSNSNIGLPSEPEELAFGVQGSIAAENEDLRISSASESSVTCLGGRAGTQAPVESCLSSADCTQEVLPQHVIHEDQVSLIDLPNGSSLGGEGHATLLTPLQAHRVGPFDGHGRPISDGATIQQIEADTLSGCNEGSVAIKNGWLKDNLNMQELESGGKDLINWDLHSKPGSEVVSAAAASGESEEVEQRVSLQSGGELDHPLCCLSAPGNSLSQHETTEKEPTFGSKYVANTNSKELTKYQTHHEKNDHNLNSRNRFPLFAPSSEGLSHSNDVHAKDLSEVFDIECSQVDNEQNNQMMLHLFLDDPKPHSDEFLSTDASSCHGLSLQERNLCGSKEVMSLASHRSGNTMVKEHEPITELSLLVDDRSAKQKYRCDQGESVSSRTQSEFFQQSAMEPHWMVRHNKQEAQVNPFRQNRELCHLMQTSQDACSPLSFSPMQPLWSTSQQNAAGTVSHPSFTNHWNMEEHVDQTNWIPPETTAGAVFSSGKDECGRTPVSEYWDQASHGPSISSWSAKPELGFLRGNNLNVHDGQTLQESESWVHMQSQPSTHLPYMWAMDRSGRMASHPWKNASMFSSSQFEQQKLQNALLSKLNQNFTASWH